MTDAPERIWADVPGTMWWSRVEPGDPAIEYVRADLYAKMEVAEARQAEKVATLEQEVDCYKVFQKPHDPDDCPLCESLRTIRDLRAAIRALTTRAARPVLFPPDERWYAIEVPADEWTALRALADEGEPSHD